MKSNNASGCILWGALFMTMMNGEVPLANAADKPNVLLILVDDVGYCDVGAFASRLPRVPTDH